MSSLNFNFKSLFDWKSILLLIALIIIITMQCNDVTSTSNKILTIDKKKYEIKKKSIDTLYIPKQSIYYTSGSDIYTIVIEYDTIFGIELVDTAAILKDYFSKVLSIDTLNLKDSLGYIVIRDTITQNRILGRDYISNINKMVIRDTTWLSELKTPILYAGINAGVSNTHLPNQFGLSLLYQTPKNLIYGIGVGLQNGNVVTPYIHGSLHWKLKFKKNGR